MFTYKDLVQNEEVEGGSEVSYLKKVVVEKVDERTVSFSLPEENVFFKSYLTLGILPKHILGLLPPGNLVFADFNLKPVGAGPYKLSDVGEEPIYMEEGHWVVKLTRNEDYHNEVPKIETVVMHIFPTYRELASNLNLLTVVKGVPTGEVERFRENSRFKVYEYTLPQYVALFFNENREVMKDPKLRFALLLGTDKEEIIKAVVGERVDTPYLEEPRDLEIKYDKTHAEAALLAAGWQIRGEGEVRKKGEGEEEKDLSLKLLTTSGSAMSSSAPPYEQIARMLQVQWGAVGVQLEIEVLPWEEFGERVAERDYDILLFGQNRGMNPDLKPFWHSQNAEGGLNFSELKNFEVDVLLEDVRKETDEEKREEIFRRISARIAAPVRNADNQVVDGVVAVFLYTPKFFIAMDERVKGVGLENLTSSADRFSEIGNWYMREEKSLQEGVNLGMVWQWFISKL